MNFQAQFRLSSKTIIVEFCKISWTTTEVIDAQKSQKIKKKNFKKFFIIKNNKKKQKKFFVDRFDL